MSEPVKPAPPKVAIPLLEKFGTPLFWLAVGYGMGFFHGNTSGKRKALTSG